MPQVPSNAPTTKAVPGVSPVNKPDPNANIATQRTPPKDTPDLSYNSADQKQVYSTGHRIDEGRTHNTPADQSGSGDYAADYVRANIGAPGTNRSEFDDGLDGTPTYAKPEHETIADEQRRRSENYQRNIGYDNPADARIPPISEAHSSESPANSLNPANLAPLKNQNTNTQTQPQFKTTPAPAKDNPVTK